VHRRRVRPETLRYPPSRRQQRGPRKPGAWGPTV